MPSIHTTPSCYGLCRLNGCFPIHWSLPSRLLSSSVTLPLLPTARKTLSLSLSFLSSVPVTSTKWPVYHQDFLVPWPTHPPWSLPPLHLSCPLPCSHHHPYMSHHLSLHQLWNLHFNHSTPFPCSSLPSSLTLVFPLQNTFRLIKTSFLFVEHTWL